MNCSNPKCSLQFMEFVEVTCNHCPLKFCSDKCLIIHSKFCYSHNKIPKKSFTISPFLKKGEMLNKFMEDPLPYYDFSNFDYIETIDNRKKIIGKGTYSEVFLVKNSLDEHNYAIKRINKEMMLLAKQSLNSIYQEIAIHRKIVNENVLRVYNLSEDNLFVYVLMEYADNGSLSDWIKRYQEQNKEQRIKKGMEEKKVFNLFIQIASAIAFLHQNNLNHRELTLNNILMCTNNKDKIKVNNEDEGAILKLFNFNKCTKISTVDNNNNNNERIISQYNDNIHQHQEQDNYTANDIKSLGMILYELLHGDNYTNSNNIIKDNLNKECFDLLIKLLAKDDKTRIKAIDIFNHPWVKGFENEFIIINKNKEITSFTNEINKETSNHFSKRHQSNNGINKLLYPGFDNDVFNYDVYDNTINKAKEEAKSRSKSKPKIRTEIKKNIKKGYGKLHKSNHEIISSSMHNNEFIQDIRPIPKHHDSSIEFEYGRKGNKLRRQSKKNELEIGLLETTKTSSETVLTTPIPMILPSYQNEDITPKTLIQALELLEYQTVYKSNDNNNNKNKQHSYDDEKVQYQGQAEDNKSFWDKWFINFKCGTPHVDN